ncbi:MAG: MFS transporter, partial [Chloroflexota bacterium]
SQFLVLAAYGGVFTIYPLFATQQMSWSVLDVGLLVSAFGCGAILIGPRLARLADRTNRAAVGTFCLWAVALWLALTLELAPSAVIFALGFAAGGAFAAYNGAWYALLTASIPPAMQTKVLAVVLAVSQLGVVAGATASSAAWQVWSIVVGLMVVVAAALMASATMAVLWRTESRPPSRGQGDDAGGTTPGKQVEGR